MPHAELLTDLLRKITAERSISNPQIKLQPISSGGANYTAKLFLATVSDGDTELKLFAKVAVVGEKFREQLPMRIFDIENEFYTSIVKFYKQLEEEHNLSDEHKFIPPKYYGSSVKQYEEIMVLENLSAQDYVVYDRLKSVHWPYAAKAVEELAKFHALSFAFQKEYPEEYNKFVEEFGFIWNSSLHQYWVSAINTACSVVREENKQRVRKFLEKIDAGGYTGMYEPLRATVLGHCDYRVSNQMYKIDADGRIHMRIVDYQTIRAAPPVLDLLYFIFTSTDEKFRAQYYEKLLDHYYSELCEAMRRFSIDPEEVYSRADFDEEYRAKLPFGLTVAVFSLPIITVDVENAPVVDEDMDISKLAVSNLSSLFPERINGIINDYIRSGVL